MSEIWKPNTTVAAVIERNGRFLLVEELVDGEIKYNQPAGHVDEGEAILAACVRETLEETAFHFTPTHLVGIYQWTRRPTGNGLPVTFIRFTFGGELGAHEPERRLDDGILRTLWLTPQEIAAKRHQHRSPLLQRCLDDHLAGRRYPLDLLHTIDA